MYLMVVMENLDLEFPTFYGKNGSKRYSFSLSGFSEGEGVFRTKNKKATKRLELFKRKHATALELEQQHKVFKTHIVLKLLSLVLNNQDLQDLLSVLRLV